MQQLLVLAVLSIVVVSPSNGMTPAPPIEEEVTIPPPSMGEAGPDGTSDRMMSFPVPSNLYIDFKNFQTVCWKDGERPIPQAQPSLTCPSVFTSYMFPAYSESCKVHPYFVGYKCPYVRCRASSCIGVRSIGIFPMQPICVPSQRLIVYYWLICRNGYQRRYIRHLSISKNEPTVYTVVSIVNVWTSNGQIEDITLPPPTGANETMPMGIMGPDDLFDRGALPSSLYSDFRNFHTVCWKDGVRPIPQYQPSLTCPTSAATLVFPPYSEDCRVHSYWVGYKCPYVKCQLILCRGVVSSGIFPFQPYCVWSDKVTVYYWLVCRNGYRRRSIRLPQCCSCEYQ